MVFVPIPFCCGMWAPDVLMKNHLGVENTKTGKTNISCIINLKFFNIGAKSICNFIRKSFEK